MNIQKKIKKISLVLLIVSTLNFHHTQGIDFENKIVIGGSIAGVSTCLYVLYSWLVREPSIEDLCWEAHQLNEALHRKHGSITLLHKQLAIDSEAQLFDLANKKDIRRVGAVAQDLPQLSRMISMLKKRLQSEENFGKARNEELYGNYIDLCSLKDRLERVAVFWKQHIHFFTLHQALTECTNDSVYKKILGVSMGAFYDYYIDHKPFPFAQLESQIRNNIKQLRNLADPCEVYPVLFAQAGGRIEELNMLLHQCIGLERYANFEQLFNEGDQFARKLSYQNPEELFAIIQGIYAGNFSYPFEYIVEAASKLLSSLQDYQTKFTASLTLFNQDDPFWPRAYDLIKRSDELIRFLKEMRSVVAASDFYKKECKRKRKDKQYAQRVALEKERIEREDARRKEELKMQKEYQQELLKQEKERLRIEKQRIRLEREAADALKQSSQAAT